MSDVSDGPAGPSPMSDEHSQWSEVGTGVEMAYRLTVDLDIAASQHLDELEALTGLRSTEIVRRALQAYVAAERSHQLSRASRVFRAAAARREVA